jgi:periplasmic divalent cation tolerance protein
VPTSTHCMVITTTDSAEDAERLARSIVEARVGACAQVVGPIKSVYWWDGAVQSEQEWQIWIKTTTAELDALTDHIKANHSYDVPEVAATPIIGGNPAYLRWVTAETRAT